MVIMFILWMVESGVEYMALGLKIMVIMVMRSIQVVIMVIWK